MGNASVVDSVRPDILDGSIGATPDLMSGRVDKCAILEAVCSSVRVFLVPADDLVWNVVFLAVGFFLGSVNLIHDKDLVVVLRRLFQAVEGGHKLHVGKVWQISRTVGLDQGRVTGFRQPAHKVFDAVV